MSFRYLYLDSYLKQLLLNLTNMCINFIGLSCKTQEIYLLVFCIRYMDLFMYYISLYNSLMKVFFISSAALLIFLMRFKKPYCTVSTLIYCINNHPFVLDIWCPGRWLPSFQGITSSCSCTHLYRSIWMDSLGTCMELQSMAWKYCFHPSNHYAEQNPYCWKYHFSLRRCPRTL